MVNIEPKIAIQNALQGFSRQPLADAARRLLKALGYASEKRLDVQPNTAKQFRSMFDPQGRLRAEQTLLDQWKSVDMLFQITDAEIAAGMSGQGQLFVNKQVDDHLINSYLFFAIELTGANYTRTALAGITREVNKLFPMPVMILFKHSGMLSFAIIARRLSKRDPARDVLEKVTLIKDIRCNQPHRAHLEILFDLSLGESRNFDVTNFVELQRAWEKTLDTSELNKKFYREVADWYFWAVNTVEFPKDAEAEMSVIRLITRLIFVWFIKEKGLVPEDLFDERKLKNILQYNDPRKSNYYKAILQNLFFATLNTEMGDRKFRGKNKNPDGRDQHYGISTVYRYEDYFKVPKETALNLFAGIPFLNGGLFECLDKPEEKVYIDGFSDTPKNQPVVPDTLFFGAERSVDLSAAYGDDRRTREKVRGLIHIFNDYKFTIEENTPVEEEVALDPELLGKVFENLLAAYNPETGTTARKQTGSFYTPREIVNYMVDEALLAYLETALVSDDGRQTTDDTVHGPSSTVAERLRHLLAYNNELHQFSEEEEQKLIAAIDVVKVLDPACGSGAFPMGVLHKLVFLLNKLDPGNTRWKERQISKASEFADTVVREAAIESIEEVFRQNFDDYGRKLYLIENCIYGVDIQPIAVQIAKLRFFISLVVEQKTDPARPNLGIRPLPNLETRFVAANALIGLQKPEAGKETAISFGDMLYQTKRDELKEVRKKHFSARTPGTKAQYREQDKKLRDEISELLKKDGWGGESARLLAGWDPYNQNAHADFFDPEWMFGIESGFDVVIGNPPYSAKQSTEMKFLTDYYDYVEYKCDPYAFFVELGWKLVKKNAQLTYILPVTWMTNFYYAKLRSLLIKTNSLKEIVLIKGLVFENANVDTCLLFIQKQAINSRKFKWINTLPTLDEVVPQIRDYESVEKEERLDITPAFDIGWENLRQKLDDQSVRLDKISKISLGMKLRSNDAFVVEGKDKKHLDPIYFGADISYYGALKPKRFFDFKSAEIVGGTKNPAIQTANPKILIQAIRNLSLARRIVAAIDYDGYCFIGTVNSVVIQDNKYSTEFLLGLINSTLLNTYFRNRFTTISLTSAFLGVLPIKKIEDIQKDSALKDVPSKIGELVDKILAAKRADPRADTSALEGEIDRLVYELYGLTEEEVRIVEGRP
jgi:hypothetical protein